MTDVAFEEMKDADEVVAALISPSNYRIPIYIPPGPALPLLAFLPALHVRQYEH